MKREPPNGWNLIASDDEGFAAQLWYHGINLRVVASWGCGWDHVSVSTPNRCPTWDEMSFVKELFFLPNEGAMQLHPPRANWINCHPFCLHLWRPQELCIQFPPTWMVGPTSATTELAG